MRYILRMVQRLDKGGVLHEGLAGFRSCTDHNIESLILSIHMKAPYSKSFLLSSACINVKFRF